LDSSFVTFAVTIRRRSIRTIAFRKLWENNYTNSSWGIRPALYIHWKYCTEAVWAPGWSSSLTRQVSLINERL